MSLCIYDAQHILFPYLMQMPLTMMQANSIDYAHRTHNANTIVHTSCGNSDVPAGSSHPAQPPHCPGRASSNPVLLPYADGDAAPTWRGQGGPHLFVRTQINRRSFSFCLILVGGRRKTMEGGRCCQGLNPHGSRQMYIHHAVYHVIRY